MPTATILTVFDFKICFLIFCSFFSTNKQTNKDFGIETGHQDSKSGNDIIMSIINRFNYHFVFFCSFNLDHNSMRFRLQFNQNKTWSFYIAKLSWYVYNVKIIAILIDCLYLFREIDNGCLFLDFFSD